MTTLRHCRIGIIAVSVLIFPLSRWTRAQESILEGGTRYSVGQIENKEKQKLPCGTVEEVDGKFGKATKLTFIDGASGGFITARICPTPEWDKTAGFSFWVKGDGSNHWGGIELIDRDDFSLRYGYCFPIDSTDWQKIIVPWRDVIPELAGPLVSAAGGFPPSHFGNFFFGKWFYWRDYPAESFTIDRAQFENAIEDSAHSKLASRGIDRFVAKLRAHQPVTIVTMGDSLSDKHHWSNHDSLWQELLVRDLKSQYGSEVTLVNPSIGGTTLSQNLILMPRWGKEAPSPDLVTVWFGGNDWDTQVRGPRFREYLDLAVDRIRRQTHGSADIILMTTCPGYERWEMYSELEKAARDVAAEKQTGLADIAVDFRKAAGSPAEGLKQEYWAEDKVHLGAKGKQTAKDSVLKLLDSWP